MARPLRVEYEGAVYHVMARGQERGAIIRDDADRERFLEELAGVVGDVKWAVHAYCLMTNHYHVLIETPLANLSLGMQLLNGAYSQAFNLRHRRRGHVFEDRFKAIVVEKEGYLLELCRYVVLNPVRAGMARSAREYRWTSYRATSGEVARPVFLEVEWTLSRFGQEVGRAREAYRRFVAEGKGVRSPLEDLTGQVFLGSPAFVSEMRRRLEASPQGLPMAIPRAQREVGFVSLEVVLAAVAEEYGIAESQLLEPWRRGEERAVALYLARRLTGMSGTKLGERFGVTSARVGQLVKIVEAAENLPVGSTAKRLLGSLRGH